MIVAVRFGMLDDLTCRCTPHSSSAIASAFIYNNEADCISVDASFGIGGDCIAGPAKGDPGPVYTSDCPTAVDSTQRAAAALGNRFNRNGYFSVWVLANTPPSCQAVSRLPLCAINTRNEWSHL